MAAILAVAFGSAPALAQAPAAKPPAAPAKQAAPGVFLWWNDPDLVTSLSLSAEQRKKMDQIFEKQPRSATPGGPGTALEGRGDYFKALGEGDMERARKELASWADEASAEIRSLGGMRIEVLSVLTAAQRKILGTISPPIPSVPWIARASWRPTPPSPPPGAKMGPPKKPGVPAAKPPDE